MNRRQFARSVAAFGAVSATPLAVALTATTVLPVHLVYDQRITHAGLLAHAAFDCIARAYPCDADVTRVWFDTLHDLWNDRRIITLGLTRYAEFFVLSTLARDRGQAVARVGERDERVAWMLVPGSAPPPGPGSDAARAHAALFSTS